ncbi:MAG: hypothetical protein MK364_23365, partial [Pirellulales bacterium]|nr:hypothetical protein [Pirellulales bacterium]
MTRFGQLAAVVLLLILGFQWIGPSLFRFGIQPVRDRPQSLADAERLPDPERPPEPVAVRSAASLQPETPSQVMEAQGLPAEAAGTSAAAQSTPRRFPWQQTLDDQ